jgi:FMN phosphatase YigB (HAD superfamily)
MISTIIFDLNYTLVGIRFDDPERRYDQALGVSQENFFKAAFKYWQDYEIGKFGQDNLFNFICRDLGISQQYVSLVLQLFSEDVYLIEGMDEVLERLFGKYRLLLLAGDGEDLLHMKLDKFNLTRYFAGIYCTCCERLHKNNPQIYRNVLAKERVNPSSCIYIDDRPDFIRLARDAGMNAILFKDSSQLKKDLREYLIYLD